MPVYASFMKLFIEDDLSEFTRCIKTRARQFPKTICVALVILENMMKSGECKFDFLMAVANSLATYNHGRTIHVINLFNRVILQIDDLPLSECDRSELRNTVEATISPKPVLRINFGDSSFVRRIQC